MFAKVREAIENAIDNPFDHMPPDWTVPPGWALSIEQWEASVADRIHDPDVHLYAFTIRGVVFSIALAAWEADAPAPPPAPAAVNRVLPFPPPVVPLKKPPTWSGWSGTYAEYTSHPEFQRLAALAKKEWGFKCLLNVNHRGPVEMHHRSYARVPFGETWQDLVPLCEECHGRHHLRLAKPPIGLFDEDAIKKAA